MATLPQVTLAVDCAAKATKINPYIYGIAFYPFDDKKQGSQWQVDATARRWGGNTTSTYNWELDAWNTGNDWFFENGPRGGRTREFFEDNASHKMASALTVPILGWVAKDKTSYSFPVVGGRPARVDRPLQATTRATARRRIRQAHRAGPPSRTYMPITPGVREALGCRRSAKEDAKTGKRSVYIVHPRQRARPLELDPSRRAPRRRSRTTSSSSDRSTTARRSAQADPDAVIAGPAEWGWTNYIYSAKDMVRRAARCARSPRPRRLARWSPIPEGARRAREEDRRARPRRPRPHLYPQADGVCGDRGDDDAEVAALRIRTTRTLWDSDATSTSRGSRSRSCSCRA